MMYSGYYILLKCTPNYYANQREQPFVQPFAHTCGRTLPPAPKPFDTLQLCAAAPLLAQASNGSLSVISGAYTASHLQHAALLNLQLTGAAAAAQKSAVNEVCA
jgi:hypothetical protein